MKRPYSNKSLLVLLLAVCFFTACQKGDPGSGSDNSSNNSNNSNNNSNNNTNNNNPVTPPAATGTITVSTFAGSPQNNPMDGTGTAAGFKSPRNIAVDASGNLFVTDPLINEIREVTPGAVVTTFATSSSFTDITSNIAVDGSGNVYTTDGSVYKISPLGVVAQDNLSLGQPHQLTYDTQGNIFVASNGVIYKLRPTGAIAAFAGSGQAAVTDGMGTSASFNSIGAMATDPTGNLFVADVQSSGPVIRKITTAGVVTSIVLTSVLSANSAYSGPIIGGIAVDGNDNIYATDTGNNRILKITSSGAVTVVAGTGTGGYLDGTGASAKFYYPMGIVVNSAGSTIYVVDAETKTIRKIVIQ